MSSVVGRAAFAQLRSDGHRYRSGPLRCRFLPNTSEPRRAFAIGRKFGPAVTRNRARRRVDAAIEAIAHQTAPPPGDYLFACSRSVLTLDFVEITQHVEQVFAMAANDHSVLNRSANNRSAKNEESGS